MTTLGMRHPVSTIATSRRRDGLCGAVAGDVVGRAILPAAPEDAGPRAGEDADRVRMATASGPSALVDEGGPPGGVTRIVGEGGEGPAQALVTGPAEDDRVVLAGGLGDGGQAGLGGELVVGGEASAIVAELGQDLRGVDGATARQALHEPTIRMLRQRGGDGGGEVLDVRHERAEHGDDGPDDVAARLGFRLADLAGGGAVQPGEQLGHGAAATVGVLPEELGEAPFAQARGTVGSGVAGEKGEGDGRGDVGEDRGRPGPEALQQRAQLIREGDALGHEVLAAAHEGAQGARVVGGRVQRPEPMAIGAQHVGEDKGVARVTLAAGGRVARPTRLERVRVDGHHLESGVDERVDEQTGGAFEGHADGPAPTEAAQSAEKGREALTGVRHGTLPVKVATGIEDADRMGLTGPVDADEESHCVVSGDGETLHGERSCRSLTDWRSGLAGHVARHPVAGRGLSVFCSGERVSFWPSHGERAWLSPNAHCLAPLSSLPPNSASDFRCWGRVGQ